MSTFDKYLLISEALFLLMIVINFFILILLDDNLNKYKKYHLFNHGISSILSVIFCIINGYLGNGFELLIWALCSIAWLRNYLYLRKLYNL